MYVLHECMHACVYVCAHVYVYVYSCICTCAYLHICLYVCINVCTQGLAYTQIYKQTDTCHTNIHTHTCLRGGGSDQIPSLPWVYLYKMDWIRNLKFAWSRPSGLMVGSWINLSRLMWTLTSFFFFFFLHSIGQNFQITETHKW